MKNLYDVFDETLMKETNRVVRAYNWTTGKTKSQLANSMLTIAPILESVGMITIYPSLTGIIPFNILASHTYQKQNQNQEKIEQESLEKRAKSLEVEKDTKYHKLLGFGFGGCGAYELYVGLFSNLPYKSRVGLCLFGAGAGIRGSSHYVMRAESLPPRKNCFARGIEKLKEKLRTPNLVPQPIKVQYCKDINSYILSPQHS